MSLRQVQVLSGGLQVVVSQQNLDGAQVSACFQQVSGPTVTQRMRSNAFVDASPMCSFATCDPDGLNLRSALRSARDACVWETSRASACAIASTLAGFPVRLDSGVNRDPCYACLPPHG